MSERVAPKPAFLPFVLGDLLLLAIAGGIAYQSPHPLSPALIALVLAAAAIGAWLLVTPFILQYRAQLQIADAESFGSAVTQMEHLQKIQAAITGATAMWQNVQLESARTVNTAKEVADGMAHEAKTFMEFMQKANDSEKAALRVDVDKRQRMELEWLQVTVRILDHVFALNQAAVQSGQPGLIENLNQFQFACRDAARRVGLAVVEVQPGEAFNPEIHQLPDGAPAPADAKVGRVLAIGYTWQGRLLRPVVVTLSDAVSMTLPQPAEAAAAPEGQVVAEAVPAAENQTATETNAPAGTSTASGQPDLI